MSNMYDYGTRLALAMIKKNMEQKKLAEILGVAQPSISRVVNGKQFLDFDLAIRACEVLDISLDWLAYGRESVHKPVYYNNPERQRIEYLMSILQESDYKAVIVALEGIIEIRVKGGRMDASGPTMGTEEDKTG